MAKHKDRIPGGLADKKNPSDFDSKALEEGIKIELEHTSDKAIAQEIAMDHLTEDKDYYKKLREVEKQDMTIITPDGKTEIVEGKEPLKKDPRSRWNKLKKAFDGSNSFLNIEEAMQPDAELSESAQASQVQEDQDAMADQSGTEEPAANLQENENQDVLPPEEGDQSETSQDESDHSSAEDKIIQALKDDGYSESEIAYIVHGHHAPELSETDATKAQAIKAMSDIDANHAQRQADLEHEHSRRMNDVEYEKAKNELSDPDTEKNHRKRMLDLEYDTHGNKKKEAELALEHKKRMMDLEYERAKQESNKEDPSEAAQQKQLDFELEMKRKEKELELDFKKKELELKLQIQAEIAKQKAEQTMQQIKDTANEKTDKNTKVNTKRIGSSSKSTEKKL